MGDLNRASLNLNKTIPFAAIAIAIMLVAAPAVGEGHLTGKIGVECGAEFVSFYSHDGMYMSDIGYQTVRRTLITRLSSTTKGVRLHTAEGWFTLYDEAYDAMFQCLQDTTEN